MLDQRYSDNDQSKRDIPSFIEPMPPLVSNPFMRPRPQKGTNLLEQFEEDSVIDEPELVQVYLRLKPYHAPNNLYEIRSDRCLITSVDTATAGHGRRTQHNVSKMYTFSHIFGPGSTQKEVFENVVKDNLKKLPEGHNFTLLTYGASGSGKTYTLMGTVASPGLVPRSLEYVFRVVEAAQQPLHKPADGGSEKLNMAEQDYEIQWVKRLRHISAPLRDKYRRMSAGLCNDFTMSTMDLSNRTRHYVWVSFVEIYNEGIYDLLASSDRRNASKLRIREDASGNVYVKGITQAFVRTGEEAYDVMVAGKHNLQVAATGVHAQSSRSHCIFTITMLTETESGVRTSCVRLCDLAGCERARRTRNTGARMAESRAINSSLHVLERCLHTLRRRQRRVLPACVPYRESKLTRLLGSGLSGARGEAVSMVVTLNPAPEYAHETKHVLQLAAVARDIQVNNTIAETTLESSTQDTTVSSTAEVMKLRSDNERLHFELVQAQSRNKELSAAMEERQQEAAATMRELVEEAKDMTRQYYEAQIEALRSEMEDTIEEYESRLSKAAKPVAESGTPSRSLQKRVAELMTEVAILEEKLTAERLARARAEEEVQHLRACIEERDEKAFEENTSANREDVMLLSDSEHDSEEEVDDPCNESLEPTFKKEDINKSRLLLQNTFDQHSIHSENSLNNSARSNLTIENENSVMDKSRDTLKDDTGETNKDSVYATGEDDSGSTNKTNEFHDSVANETRNVSDLKLPATQNEGKRNVSEYNQTYDNNPEFLEDPLEAIDEKVVVNNSSNDYEFLKPTDSVPRGTYFVRSDKTNEDADKSLQNVIAKKFNSLTRGTYCVKEVDRFAISAADTLDDEDVPKEPLIENKEVQQPVKISDTLVSKIIKSISKTSHSSNSSLAQFEQLEKAANICDETRMEGKDSFGDVNMLKEKRTYFDSPKVVVVDSTKSPKLNKEKKTYFDNIDVNIEPPSKNATETNNEVNNLQFDDTRSPSIVKDDINNDFKPSAIQKLLGESFTRQPEIISSVQKVKVLHKKHESVDMFEGLDSPRPIVKTPERNIEIDVVEQARISIHQMVLEQKSANKAVANLNRELKLERASIAEEIETAPLPADTAQNITNGMFPQINSPNISNTSDNMHELKSAAITASAEHDIAEALPETKEKPQIVDVKKEPNESFKVNNTIEEFDNLYKDISASRATEFELLVSQSNTTATKEKIDNVSATLEETKYNLRHKSNKEGVTFADKVEKEPVEEPAKCESKAKSTKRSLRLRRRKNQSEDDQTEQENKLKDIVNLQKEFSDVTMDVPAPVKVVKDIQSPGKPPEEEENLPPLMGIQSCPSKSVTRSRRKLFTPRAEPLDESLTQPGDSSERVYVPRPSYHRARARRKL